MAPPTGPRGGRAPSNNNNNNRATRSASRGGIAKRGRANAPRVDRDGDLDMGTSTAATRSGAGAKQPATNSTRRGAPRSSGPNRQSARLQQNIVRHLDRDQIPRGPASDRASGSNNTTLKIVGLKASRAATNSDGGVRSLLDFLEKKATNIKTTGSGPGRRVRPVVIKKVCQGIQSRGTGGLAASSRSFAVSLP